MKRRRDEIEIIAAILECIINNKNHKATKSKIMYGSYLYYIQLADYLSLLIENELIEYQKSDHTYVTTAKELGSPNFSFWWLENQKVANEADPSF